MKSAEQSEGWPVVHNGQYNLPQGDHTPANYQLPLANWREHLKRPIRHWIYPVLNAVQHRSLATRYATPEFQPDLWLLGQRGNDYERHRRRVNRLLPLQGRDIHVAGCGTGRDVESWLRYRPRRVLGYDWFRYDRAWQLWLNHFNQIAPDVQVSFNQGDLAALSEIPDASFDVVASDAVFEHLRNLPEVLREFYRVLRPDGVVYATFGPLWCAWGGDHISGYDSLDHGYNHLLLPKAEYLTYLAGMGEQCHSEHDGRTWVANDLFSRLRPVEYLKAMADSGFQRCFVMALIDPRGIACLQDEDLAVRLLSSYMELDLLVTAITLVYRKPRVRGGKKCVS